MPVRQRKKIQEVLRRVIGLRALYQALFVLGLVLGLPWFLFRMTHSKRFRAGLWQRLGLSPPPRRQEVGPCLWVHGVSVGEVMAARGVVEQFQARHPDWVVAVSSTTLEGFGLARRIFPATSVFYFPLDLRMAVRRTFGAVVPTAVVLMELELWPMFLAEAHRRSCPVILVNGRITGKSFRGYRRIQRMLPQFDLITAVGAQNTEYADRFTSLGVPSARVSVTGNVKIDAAAAGLGCVSEWPGTGPPDDRPWLVAGSTHEGEEQIIGRAAGDCWLLICAPRHPERAKDAEMALRVAGRRVIRISALRSGAPCPPGADVLLDTIGDLQAAYTLASAAFVGGSLVPHGGQNVLEPAGCGIPVVVGPHTGNFAYEVSLLESAGGLHRVETQSALSAVLDGWISEPGLLVSQGRAARKAVEAHTGACERNLIVIEEALADAGL